jgi:hypothetical protein
MKKKVQKKLSLNRETLLNLKNATGGLYERQVEGVASEGPDICYFSDCNPCETTIYADREV